MRPGRRDEGCQRPARELDDSRCLSDTGTFVPGASGASGRGCSEHGPAQPLVVSSSERTTFLPKRDRSPHFRSLPRGSL